MQLFQARKAGTVIGNDTGILRFGYESVQRNRRAAVEDHGALCTVIDHRQREGRTAASVSRGQVRSQLDPTKADVFAVTNDLVDLHRRRIERGNVLAAQIRPRFE